MAFGGDEPVDLTGGEEAEPIQVSKTIRASRAAHEARGSSRAAQRYMPSPMFTPARAMLLMLWLCKADSHVMTASSPVTGDRPETQQGS